MLLHADQQRCFILDGPGLAALGRWGHGLVMLAQAHASIQGLVQRIGQGQVAAISGVGAHVRGQNHAIIHQQLFVGIGEGVLLLRACHLLWPLLLRDTASGRGTAEEAGVLLVVLNRETIRGLCAQLDKVFLEPQAHILAAVRVRLDARPKPPVCLVQPLPWENTKQRGFSSPEGQCGMGQTGSSWTRKQTLQMDSLAEPR